MVFRSGEGALSVLPDLVDVIPEARLNLVIYYLKQARLGLHSSSLLAASLPSRGRHRSRGREHAAADALGALQPAVPESAAMFGIFSFGSYCSHDGSCCSC